MPVQNNKRLSLIFGIVLLAAAGGIAALNFLPQKKYSQSQMLFSDDDGKTWYQDSNDLIPPYKHNGKDAVGAVVYQYANGSKQFCGYLFRFPADVKKQIENSAQSGSGKSAHNIAYGTEMGLSREVKAPNTPGPWVRMGSLEAAAVTKIKSPDGSELDSVVP